ncbi:MAG TPA: hypothetical protein ENH40_01420 [Nitrospirae bacterium]|nr:hypothetical protein [Nitrospirota bacterium]
MKRILVLLILILAVSNSGSYAQMGDEQTETTEEQMEMTKEQTEMTEEQMGMTKEQTEMTEEQMGMTEEEKRALEAQKKQAEEYRYKQHIRLMNEMRGSTQEIIGTLDTLSGMIYGITRLKEIPEERIRKIGSIMKELGGEMDTISGIMSRGTAGNEELIDLRSRIKETQKQMLEIIVNTPR